VDVTCLNKELPCVDEVCRAQTSHHGLQMKSLMKSWQPHLAERVRGKAGK